MFLALSNRFDISPGDGLFSYISEGAWGPLKALQQWMNDVVNSLVSHVLGGVFQGFVDPKHPVRDSISVRMGGERALIGIAGVKLGAVSHIGMTYH